MAYFMGEVVEKKKSSWYKGESLGDSSDEPVKSKPFDLVERASEAAHWTKDLVIDMVPFAKYALRAEDREAFVKMSEEQQRNALIWESVGAALWAVPIPTAYAGKGLARLMQKRALARTAKFIQPVEDLSSWTLGNYTKGLDDLLRNIGVGKELGAAERVAERAAVKDFLYGAEHALNGPLGDRAKKPASKKLIELTELGTDAGGRPSYKLTERAREMLGPEEVRRSLLEYEYKKGLYSKLKLNGPDLFKEISDVEKTSLSAASFPHIMKKIYGEPGLKKTLMTAGPEELMAAREFLRSNEAKALLKQVARPGVSALMMRVPAAFARGEIGFQAKSKIHQRVVDGVLDSEKYFSMKMKKLDEMLHERGFLTMNKKGVYKVNPKMLNRQTEAKAWKILEDMAEMEKQLSLGETVEIKAQLTAGLKASIDTARASDKAAAELVDLTVAFSDLLYADYAKTFMQRTLETQWLNGSGAAGVHELMNEVAPRIEKIFHSSAGFTAAQKNSLMAEIVDDVRRVVAKEQANWWTVPFKSKDWEKNFARINQKLKMNEKFPAYKIATHDYMPPYKGHLMNTLHSGPEGNLKPDPKWAKLASMGSDKPKTLERELLKRIRHQAEYTHLYPAMQKAAAHARKLPPGWVKLTEHLFTRVLNLPSRADVWVAESLENTAGVLLRMVGKEGTFDAHDVMNLARQANDLTYMGFLGLKPFSAMRNLFQPLIMVPTDLGGIKDIGLLTKSYAKSMTDKDFRKAVMDLGVVPQEFTGEAGHYASKMLKIRDTVGGVGIPQMEGMKAAALWMFSTSHKVNCLVSGGAAMLKWDGAVARVGTKRIGKFLQKAGVSGRRGDVRAEIETLVRLGQTNPASMAQARKLFVESVVEDTQFVYASTHTPLITQSLGGIGRTVSIFQTWWMNYGTTVHKWMTTGTLDAKAHRAMTNVISGAVAYQLMRIGWDKEVAAKTVWAGPFPSAGDLARMPPIYTAMAEVMKVLPALSGMAEGEGEYSEKVQQQLARAVRTTFPLVVPGGLQIKQSWQRTGEEGLPGLVKSLVRFKKD